MITLETARRLKAAGLEWQPALLDFFAIPDREMDDKVFVISDIQVTVEALQGMQMVSFQGVSEWALDSLVADETVWLPSEAQLRQAVEAALLAGGRPELRLSSSLEGYRCAFQYKGRALAFEAASASEAYAAALLYLLQEQARAHPAGGTEATSRQ
jgi:hypothetical protein